MTFGQLTERMPPEGVFRSGQILAGERAPAHVRRQIDRWVKAGRLIRLRRGVYMLNRPWIREFPHPFVVANVLVKASYVTLHSALSHYGMIPEAVPVTTSLTTGRPEALETPVGRFQYRHVHPRLFDGFTDSEVAPGQHALIARPEKALVDLLYLTPDSDDTNYFRALRVEPPAGTSPDTFLARLYSSANSSRSAKVERAVRQLSDLWSSE